MKSYKGTKELREWICGSDFFTAPCSIKYHLNEEGGLCLHSLNVFDRLTKLLKDEYGDDVNVYQSKLDIDSSSIALVALCHDLCKCNCYEKSYFNKKVYKPNGSKQDAGGRFDWESIQSYEYKPKLVYGHGAQSAMIVQTFIKDVSLTELMAIRFHMGGIEYPGQSFIEPNITSVYNEYPIVLWLHIADLEASYIDEKILDE